jgi:hypothetical protein
MGIFEAEPQNASIRMLRSAAGGEWVSSLDQDSAIQAKAMIEINPFHTVTSEWPDGGGFRAGEFATKSALPRERGRHGSRQAY